jgi:hypothetical protein
MGRWAPLVLLSCVAALACSPAAQATEGTGRIEGKAISAEGLIPQSHIEVTAYEAAGSEFPAGFAVTNGQGEYVVEGLAPGSYVVEFAPERGSVLNFIAQYYKDSPTRADATRVVVSAGSATPNIDAEMQTGAKIEGHVTQAASPEAGLANIAVTAYQAGNSEQPMGFATTNASGAYTIAGLATGSYTVEFAPETESGLNYVTQYWDDASSFAGATPVTVTQPASTTGIDAQLQAGGAISGTVTDAATHKPLSAVVVAWTPSHALAGVVFTNASGQYTITGLASGSYVVGFESSKHIAQYYNGASVFASATPVGVTQGSVTTAIDAALVPKAPVNTLAPVASGTAAAGGTLSCSTGTWTGSPAPTFAYSWLRDGVAIAGATASTYTVQPADQGNGLTCKVTAANVNGTSAAVSNTLIVPVPPPPPPPPPLVRLSTSRLVASRNAVRVRIACQHADCFGSIELTEQVMVKRRRGRRTISAKRTLILGKGSYALAAGHGATITLHLTSAGRSALARARRHRLAVELLATVSGGATARTAVLLSLARRR